MSLVKHVEYADAVPEVRAVYDEIMTMRKVTAINNFWKVLANDPGLLKRTWEEVRDVMAPGALDPLTKEMIYVAVSATNNCEYCTHSHTASARKQGMSDAILAEVLAVTALANKTNRLANGYRVDVDEAFKPRFD
jgi:AhpD family alkylhydroperoxidase